MNTPSLGECAQAIGTDLVAPERRGPEYLERFVASEIDKWAASIPGKRHIRGLRWMVVFSR